MRALTLISVLVTFLSSSLVDAQDWSIPSSWRKPNVTDTTEDRITTAEAALEEVISMFQPDGQLSGVSYGASGQLYLEMAEMDRAANETNYRDILKEYFESAKRARTDFLDQFLNYGLIYGHAAVKAYQVYGDEVFLNHAVTAWTSGRAYTLSDEDIEARSTIYKDFELIDVCGGITMAGGTFWTTDFDNPSLDTLGTGSFLILSALLAEVTSNDTYWQAAVQSAQFMNAHLYNAENVVLDSISARSNDSCSTFSPIMPGNAGLFIEGMAIMKSLDRDDHPIDLNIDIISRLEVSLAAATANDQWHREDGVMKSGDLHLIRGLSAVYQRNTTWSPLRDYIKNYLGVQYNALLDMATSDNSNIYGSSWIGPPSSTIEGNNQTLAASLLIGGIHVTDQQQPIQGGGDEPPTQEEDVPLEPKSNKTAIIAGSVAGSIGFLLIIGAIFFLLRRQRRVTRMRATLAPPLLGKDVTFPSSSTPFPVTALSSTTASNSRSTPAQVGQQPAMTQPPSKRRVLYGHHTSPSSSSDSNGGLSEKALLAQLRSRPAPPRPSSQAAEIQPSVSQTASREPQRRDDLPMEELVRMLNERLQQNGGQWDANEMPPEYHASASNPPQHS